MRDRTSWTMHDMDIYEWERDLVEPRHGYLWIFERELVEPRHGYLWMREVVKPWHDDMDIYEWEG